jgi:phage-related protein
LEKTNRSRKSLAWLKCEIKTPPFSAKARIEAGEYIRLVQEGEKLELPHSRPMPSIGSRCHEIRITDGDKKWRIIYRIDDDFIIIANIFMKKTQQTPKAEIDLSKRRLKDYDKLLEG